ncbi:MAG: hypothetical protein ACXACG_00960 [Candidatus Thorarchaeota archaeon]
MQVDLQSISVMVAAVSVVIGVIMSVLSLGTFLDLGKQRYS